MRIPDKDEEGVKVLRGSRRVCIQDKKEAANYDDSFCLHVGFSAFHFVFGPGRGLPGLTASCKQPGMHRHWVMHATCRLKVFRSVRDDHHIIGPGRCTPIVELY
jgi:hypothetical protein